jgi:hypothetical protein
LSGPCQQHDLALQVLPNAVFDKPPDLTILKPTSFGRDYFEARFRTVRIGE